MPVKSRSLRTSRVERQVMCVGMRSPAVAQHLDTTTFQMYGKHIVGCIMCPYIICVLFLSHLHDMLRMYFSSKKEIAEN